MRAKIIHFDVLHTCHLCMSCVHVHFGHSSLIRFPRITGYFWAEWTCAVKRGLTVLPNEPLSRGFIMFIGRGRCLSSFSEEWEAVLEHVNCKIISVKSNKVMDAYVLR